MGFTERQRKAMDDYRFLVGCGVQFEFMKTPPPPMEPHDYTALFPILPADDDRKPRLESLQEAFMSDMLERERILNGGCDCDKEECEAEEERDIAF